MDAIVAEAHQTLADNQKQLANIADDFSAKSKARIAAQPATAPTP
jgi:uncharacterized coiled-coil protein SlyX